MKNVMFVLIAFTLATGSALAAASKFTMTPAADVKWAPVPGFDGVENSIVEGDAAKGQHHSFMKFKAGFAAPLHHHTSNHFVTVVAGTMILTVDGKETKLPAGSYFSFSNKTPHMTKCDAGADCILFADVRGKWDVNVEKAPKQ
ncbi:MAG: cupin domain-containing protein [Bdellovibrionia bacterium]